MTKKYGRSLRRARGSFLLWTWPYLSCQPQSQPSPNASDTFQLQTNKKHTLTAAWYTVRTPGGLFAVPQQDHGPQFHEQRCSCKHMQQQQNWPGSQALCERKHTLQSPVAAVVSQQTMQRQHEQTGPNQSRCDMTWAWQIVLPAQYSVNQPS